VALPNSRILKSLIIALRPVRAIDRIQHPGRLVGGAAGRLLLADRRARLLASSGAMANKTPARGTARTRPAGGGI
jgi:hypothetical protein